MRAIFLKELRENIVWALLAFLAIASTIAGVAIDAHHSALFLQPVMVNKRMTPATQFGFAFVGFVLGILAIVHDRGTKRWGFLMHRPVTRSRIFLGKFVAALCLYLMATAVPLAALTIWAAIPGDVAAPFDWHMILPRLADLMSGLGFLAAGMLVAARTPARWLGSRLFPLALPLALNIVIHFLTSIWPALALLAGAVLVLVPAAWGAFIRGGEYESQPWIGRVTQAVSLAAGAFTVMLPVALTVIIVSSPVIGLRPVRSSDTVYHYILSDDGQVGIEKGAENRNWDYTDLAGNALVKFPQAKVDHLFVNGFSEIQREEIGPFSVDAYAQAIDWAQPEDYRPETNWFYVPQRRTVEGYNQRTHQMVGSIGPDGYVPAPGRAAPFADDVRFCSIAVNPAYLVVFGRSSVWWMELHRPPAIQLLYKTAPDEPIIDIGDWVNGMDSSRGWRIPIVTASALHVFPSKTSGEQEEIARIPLAQRNHDPIQVSVAHPDAGRFVMLYQPDGPAVETDGKGNITRRLALAKLPQPPWLAYGRPVSHRGAAAENLFDPPAAAWALALNLNRQIIAADVVEWIFIGLASALASWALMSRYPAKRGDRWAWTILCGMLGITGIILLVCTRQAGARVPCGKCGRLRLVANDLCEHCGAPFAPPAREGIEIFESEGARRQLEVKVSL